MKNKVKGFSMLEMIIVIGIIAILATLITPLAVNYVSQKRYNVCNEELIIIKQAIVGNPDLIEGGTRSSYGFVGDLGRLPANLLDLTTSSSMTYSWQNSSNIWYGWRGPYLNEIKDPWGNDYNYTNNWPGGNPNFQNLPPILYIIWSSGQDGISGNTDDVSISIRADEAFSMISGNTMDTCAAGFAFTGIQVFYPIFNSVAGTTAINTLQTSPHYNIQTAIPIGIRYISVGNPAMNKLIYINNGPLTIVNLRTPGVCN